MSESVSPNGAPAKRARKKKSVAKSAAVSSAESAEPRVPTIKAAAPQLTAIDRRTMVEIAAYYRAERRRFAAGHELEDWLGAEAEIEALLRTRLEGADHQAGSA